MGKVSIIIPSRNCEYVHKTVESIYDNAGGDFEVIVFLDGWKSEKPLINRKNLQVIYREDPGGMRHAINDMVDVASGEFIFKSDDHCMFAKNFDLILQEGIEENWLVTPSRYSLDAEKWQRIEKKVEYLTLTFPYYSSMYGYGFHGKKWIGMDGNGSDMGKKQYFWMENNRAHIKIDDVQTIQGSGWFMTKKHFKDIDGLDERHSAFFQEANELCFKTWLSGGACKVNKNTWYAHYHKKGSPGMGLSLNQKHETERFHTWVWMNDKWPKATKTMSWFVNSRWYPIAGWPATWKEYIKPETDFRIFDDQGKDGFKIECIQ